MTENVTGSFLQSWKEEGDGMITSTSNPRVRQLVLWQEKAKKRREDNVFLAEGIKMLREAPKDWIKEVCLTEEVLKRLQKEDGEVLAKIESTGYELLSDEVMKKVKESGTEISKNITVMPYIYNTDFAFAASDLIVCRTGAVTVSELAASGKPSIVVPSPNVAHNHQEYNAKYLSDRGAAVLIHDSELTGVGLNAQIKTLINDKNLLSEMSRKAKTAAIFDATDKIYTAARRLIK